MIKGSAICFIAGKHAGKKGWVNKEEQSDKEVTSVIVDLGRKGEKSTFVCTTSICEECLTANPKCYAEAVIHQCPDIEKDLAGVCRKMAKCEIERDPDGISEIVYNSIAAAVDWQQKKGSKAYYRKIFYDKKSSI